VTTSARRRRISTLVALVLGVVAIALGALAASVGASAIANSRAGRDVGSRTSPEVAFPVTPTALFAVVDDAGRLTSAAAMVLAPTGVGGSIVPLPATADSSLDLGDDRFPLAETYAVAGPEAFVAEAENLTAISFDVVEVVDAARLTQIIARLGNLEVDLPTDVIDDDADDFVAEAGRSTLTPSEAADVLTASTAFELDHRLEPARSEVWRAIAARVGAGIGSASAVGPDEVIPTPATPDAFLDRLFAGRVGARSLSFAVPPPERNPRSVDTVVLDRPEVILVFAQIAPARMAAPNESLTFRLEVGFTDEDLEPFGVNNADIARDVINLMLFGQANVTSVSTEPGSVPEISVADVADPLLLDGVEEGWGVLIGELDVRLAPTKIAGIDATIVLGESYLARRAVDEADRSRREAERAAAEAASENTPDDEPADDEDGDT
jgi:hypothetical protein